MQTGRSISSSRAQSLVSTSLALTAGFRFLGCLTQSSAIANSLMGLSLLLLVVNSGFVIVYDALPPWTVYLYWVSPLAYAIRALAINEFTSPRWQQAVAVGAPGDTLGYSALSLFGFYSERCVSCTYLL